MMWLVLPDHSRFHLAESGGSPCVVREWRLSCWWRARCCWWGKCRRSNHTRHPRPPPCTPPPPPRCSAPPHLECWLPHSSCWLFEGSFLGRIALQWEACSAVMKYCKKINFTCSTYPLGRPRSLSCRRPAGRARRTSAAAPPGSELSCSTVTYNTVGVSYRSLPGT